MQGVYHVVELRCIGVDVHLPSVALSLLGRGAISSAPFAVYHLRQNNYSFDALQTNCFGINIKL